MATRLLAWDQSGASREDPTLTPSKVQTLALYASSFLSMDGACTCLQETVPVYWNWGEMTQDHTLISTEDSFANMHFLKPPRAPAEAMSLSLRVAVASPWHPDPLFLTEDRIGTKPSQISHPN